VDGVKVAITFDTPTPWLVNEASETVTTEVLDDEYSNDPKTREPLSMAIGAENSSVDP
jgi:hypothetical protein